MTGKGVPDDGNKGLAKVVWTLIATAALLVVAAAVLWWWDGYWLRTG